MTDFNAQVAQCEHNIEQLKILMDQKRQEYLTLLKKEVPKFFEAEARDAASNRPAVAKSLGSEGLAPLKKKVMELVAAAPALIDERVGADDLWPHTLRRVKVDSEAPWFRTKLDFLPEKALRQIIWAVFEALASYQLVDPNFFTEGQKARGYPYGLPFSKDVARAVSEYNVLLDKWAKEQNSIDGIRLNSQKAEASDLWDKA